MYCVLRAVLWDVLRFYFRLTFLDSIVLVDNKSEMLLNHIGKKKILGVFFLKGKVQVLAFF